METNDDLHWARAAVEAVLAKAMRCVAQEIEAEAGALLAAASRLRRWPA